MKRFVIAVSGGVDSMVLLDALVHHRLSELAPHHHLSAPDYKLVVAHFDHGIREDSAEDQAFVRGVAESHGLTYESKRVTLGANASEDEARKARYSFLRQVCKKYEAQLLTAQHQDDVLETMIINLIRGTGWRGLVPMSQSEFVQRPLLDVTKAEILAYAKKYQLAWREDSTNADQNYLRNYVRATLMPYMQSKDQDVRAKLLSINQQTKSLQKEIATGLQKIIPTKIDDAFTTARYDLIMYPPVVASELLYRIFTALDPDWHPTAAQIMRTLHFVKTGASRKELQVSGCLRVTLGVREAKFSTVR